MPNILVVDDSLDNLSLMSEFIHGLGYRCRFATSGEMAYEIISTETFDLIISDYHMANGDGLWLLQKLKNTLGAPKCIIVSSDPELDSEFLIGQGAATYLTKPIDWVELKNEIDRLV